MLVARSFGPRGARVIWHLDAQPTAGQLRHEPRNSGAVGVIRICWLLPLDPADRAR